LHRQKLFIRQVFALKVDQFKKFLKNKKFSSNFVIVTYLRPHSLQNFQATIIGLFGGQISHYLTLQMAEFDATKQILTYTLVACKQLFGSKLPIHNTHRKMHGTLKIIACIHVVLYIV
jgi:hypothetical protein